MRATAASLAQRGGRGGEERGHVVAPGLLHGREDGLLRLVVEPHVVVVVLSRAVAAPLRFLLLCWWCVFEYGLIGVRAQRRRGCRRIGEGIRHRQPAACRPERASTRRRHAVELRRRLGLHVVWRWLLLGLRVLVLLRCGLLRLCVLQLRLLLLVVVQRWLVGLRRERAVRVGRGQESCCSCLRLLRRREVGFGVKLLVLVNRLLGSSRVRGAVRVRRREQATSARRRGRSEV